MAIALLIFGAAFAAFCVWLTVRIVNRHERWAKWTLAAVVAGLPVLYVLSFGAACWWASGHPDEIGIRTVPAAWLYWPIGRAKMRLPRAAGKTICRLATLYGEPLPIPITADGETLTPCDPRFD
jgi:hypothetical protein